MKNGRAIPWMTCSTSIQKKSSGELYQLPRPVPYLPPTTTMDLLCCHDNYQTTILEQDILEHALALDGGRTWCWYLPAVWSSENRKQWEGEPKKKNKKDLFTYPSLKLTQSSWEGWKINMYTPRQTDALIHADRNRMWGEWNVSMDLLASKECNYCAPSSLCVGMKCDLCVFQTCSRGLSPLQQRSVKIKPRRV